jgi:hypothetical protein
MIQHGQSDNYHLTFLLAILDYYMILRTLTHAKTPKQDAQDMLRCVVTRGNTEGVTALPPKENLDLRFPVPSVEKGLETTFT